MRVLWITHDPIRAFIGPGQSYSGFWKESLLRLLKSKGAEEISVAFPGKQKMKLSSDSYSFRYPAKKVFHQLPKITIQDLQWIIEDCKPQLIHVHGTEVPYGLISQYIKVPVVISLQGFISEWYNALLGDIAVPVWKKKKSLKEHFLKNSFYDLHSKWYKNSECERDVVRKNKYFIGRTSFDKGFVFKSNSAATYFTGHELLRDDFYQSTWDIRKIKRHSIYTSLFISPVKGFHVLLEAISYLKEEFPDLKIYVAGKLTSKMISPVFGNAFFRFLEEIIESKGLADHIEFCGKLEGNQIAKILEQTHVFALPSYMENSSNALGEAQITGVPCVASNCGGTETIIKDNFNGFLFQRGDAYELAQRIREVFLNDELAEKFSKNGKTFGAAFHSKSLILEEYSKIYTSISELENQNPETT